MFHEVYVFRHRTHLVYVYTLVNINVPKLYILVNKLNLL
jgi:hypothetical protein